MFTAATPVATIQLETMLAETNDFGNAVDFAIALIDGSLVVPDLDLDGDRGFGSGGGNFCLPTKSMSEVGMEARGPSSSKEDTDIHDENVPRAWVIRNTSARAPRWSSGTPCGAVSSKGWRGPHVVRRYCASWPLARRAASCRWPSPRCERRSCSAPRSAHAGTTSGRRTGAWTGAARRSRIRPGPTSLTGRLTFRLAAARYGPGVQEARAAAPEGVWGPARPNGEVSKGFSIFGVIHTTYALLLHPCGHSSGLDPCPPQPNSSHSRFRRSTTPDGGRILSHART
jgi:hypothetical protein